jgi:hypothetical protein
LIVNVENLLKVKALILEEPKRLNMGFFIVTGNSKKLLDYGPVVPKCGTVACLAGWGAVMAELDKSPRIKKLRTAAAQISFSVTDIACEYFDISAESGDRLFYENRWPEDLLDELGDSEVGTAEYAEVAASAIDRFIACGGDWNNDKGPATVAAAAV